MNELPECQMSEWTKEVLAAINEATADLVYSQIVPAAEVASLIEAREHLAHAILALDARLLLFGESMCQNGFKWSRKNERGVNQAASGISARSASFTRSGG